MTWSINSVCHFFGKRRFEIEDHSTNVFWLALPSFVLATAISSDHCNDAMICIPRQQARMTLTPIGMGIGLLIGQARGSRHKTDKWARVTKSG